MPLEKRMPISQNENIGNFDLFSNITEGELKGGELPFSVIRIVL